MAEPEAPAASEGGGIKEALSHKIGPLPVGVWLVIAAAVYWYVVKKNKAAPGAGQATDPAGNVGNINPQTGYVYGTPEDQAALGGGSTSLGTSSDSGTGGSTVAGQYADNQAWAVAAINYLVSIGVDATEANTAITTFLASQQLTPQQQADVNLVIQRLGAPPSPPEPGGHPGPIVTPPGGSHTYATNPPSGFTTTTISTTSIGAKWNAATNAASYTMSWGTSPNKADGSVTVSTTAATATGLKPNTLYYLRVQANPVKSGAPFATLSKTTAKSAGGGTKTGGGGTKTSTPYAHVVTKDGESFSSIAAQYHYKQGGHALWVYNYTDSPHSASAKAEIKKRGPDLIVHGETIYIPRS
jgi:hypothetical protein